mgnify:CR=1 FL=1
MSSNPIMFEKNIRPFSATVRNYGYGRLVMYTDVEQITDNNIVEELQSALNYHNVNVECIKYLDRYYRGDQPILYREKKVRPEINNKVVENHALEIVDSKVADLYGEPIQYVLADTEDESKAEQMEKLNKYMKSEDKAALDIERGRWASICGTSYYFVGKQNKMPMQFDEAPFYISCENPTKTFVVYYSDDCTPAFSVQIRKNDKGDLYNVYTATRFYRIQNGKILLAENNGNDMIPVIEYPNNERRLSDIEITIGLTDAINNMQSDRLNAIDQFVQAFILFKNSKIDAETFKKLRVEGVLSIKDTADNRSADAKMMTSELSQDGTQTSKDDLYNSLLTIQGMPSRQEASGGDTGQAVALRNGYYAEEKRAELRIPIFTRAERMMLRVVLNKLRVKEQFDLRISDIDIRPNRSKLENMMVKAQVLQILHGIGIDDASAIKTINLFSDAQDVIMKSKEKMDEHFDSIVNKSETTENIDVVEDNANGTTELRPTE